MSEGWVSYTNPFLIAFSRGLIAGAMGSTHSGRVNINGGRLTSPFCYKSEMNRFIPGLFTAHFFPKNIYNKGGPKTVHPYYKKFLGWRLIKQQRTKLFTTPQKTDVNEPYLYKILDKTDTMFFDFLNKGTVGVKVMGVKSDWFYWIMHIEMAF